MGIRSVQITLSVALLAITSCSSSSAQCCVEAHATYQVSGDPIASPLTCAEVLLRFYETSSSGCSGCFSSSATPGSLVYSERVAPGTAWSAAVDVSYVDRLRPGLDVYADCDNTCVAFATLTAGDHSGVKLDESTTCPGRL